MKVLRTQDEVIPSCKPLELPNNAVWVKLCGVFTMPDGRAATKMQVLVIYLLFHLLVQPYNNSSIQLSLNFPRDSDVLLLHRFEILNIEHGEMIHFVDSTIYPSSFPISRYQLSVRHWSDPRYPVQLIILVIPTMTLHFCLPSPITYNIDSLIYLIKTVIRSIGISHILILKHNK